MAVSIPGQTPGPIHSKPSKAARDTLCAPIHTQIHTQIRPQIHTKHTQARPGYRYDQRR